MAQGGKHIFLTGGTGFLGRTLLRHLAERGDTVHVLVRKNSRRGVKTWLTEYRKAQPEAAGRVRLLTGDLCVPGIFEEEGTRERVQDEVDSVVHAGAATHPAVERRLAYETNVQGTRAVLELARGMKGLRRFVHLSCSLVAGDHRGAFREEELLVGQGFRSRYGETKMVAERKVRAAMGELPVAIVRPAAIVGDSRTGETEKVEGLYHLLLAAHRLARLPRPLRLLPPPPGGDQLRVDVVPVDWVREAICTVLDAPDADGRCFHLTDPFALTLGEWFDLLAERLGLVRIPGQLPLGPARAVWRADLVRPVRDLLDQGADLPPEALSAFVTEAVFDTTQAERLLRPLGLTPPHAPSWAPTLIERAGALLS